MTCKKPIVLYLMLVLTLQILGCGQAVWENADEGKSLPEEETIVKQSRKSDATLDAASYLKGTYARITNDFDTAEEELYKAVKKDGESSELVSSAYILMVINGSFDRATPIARAIRKDHKNNMMAAIILMTENVKNGKYEENTEYFDAFTPTYKNLFVPLLKAWHEAATEKNKQALKTLEEAANNKEPLKDGTKEHPLKPIYVLHHGMIADYIGKDNTAKKDYLKLMESEEDIRGRSFQIVGGFFKKNVDEKNMEKLRELYKRQEGLSALLDQVTFYPPLETGKTDPKKGIAEAFFNIGAALPENESESSLVFYRLALYLNPDLHVARLSLANAFDRQGLIDEADKLYAEIPKEEQALYIAAMLKRMDIARQQMRLEDAAYLAEMLYDAYPTTLFLSAKADVYRSGEQWEKALADYEALIKKEKKPSSKLLYMKGMCQERLGRITEALQTLEEARKLTPENPYVLNYMGYVGLENDINVKESFAHVEKAAKLMPDSGEILDSLGYGYLKTGKKKKALETMQKAVALEPSSPVIQEHLGDAYKAVGDLSKAKYQYEKALTLIGDRVKEEKDWKRIREKRDGLK